MAKQEPITARAEFKGDFSEYSTAVRYHITLSTESLGEYAAASVFVGTKTITADIIALWSYSTDRGRKGTKAEREAVTAAAIAAERARQAEEAALAAIAAEPAAEQEAPQEPELYTVTFDLITLDGKERRSIKVLATSAAEAIREAKAEHERNIPLRTEWWNGGRTLVVFEYTDEIAWKLDNYATTPNPDLDEAPQDDGPDFLASLDHGTVTEHTGENVGCNFTVALQDADGRTLGEGYALIDDFCGNPTWELVCEQHLIDYDQQDEGDENWSLDQRIKSIIARAVAEYTSPDGKHPDIRYYVAAKEAEAYHADEHWFPSTDEERAASDGLSLEAWRKAVHKERAGVEDGGPGMDQLSAADQSPELRALTHAQWELAAWGYNGDGTPHRKSVAERAQQIAQLLAGTESGPRTMSRGELVDLLAQAYIAGAKAREEEAQ